MSWHRLSDASRVPQAQINYRDTFTCTTTLRVPSRPTPAQRGHSPPPRYRSILAKFATLDHSRYISGWLKAGSQVRSQSSPPSNLPEPQKPSSIETGPFLRGSCRLFSAIPVSADINGLSGGFLASSLRTQKFRSRRLNFGDRTDQPARGNRLPRSGLPAASEPIAGSIRALRTDGSIPREHRGVSRRQCREANHLRPRL